MRAVIPVAGVGTRMRPHTFSLPKVLLNVAGKPILGHILDALKEQQIHDVTIIRGYLGEIVEDYVLNNYKDMNFSFVEQEEMLGLGHAILVGEETYNGEPLLIILGDTIFDDKTAFCERFVSYIKDELELSRSIASNMSAIDFISSEVDIFPRLILISFSGVFFRKKLSRKS